ncbi:F-box domain-containing protein [Trichostrongylus colubriformis]|uniref:F-box domain-containing protein n=1 Tax=Trichostrongylus colubriformis TaxID=6319 RepID=A0AAN8IP67_TRICO
MEDVWTRVFTYLSPREVRKCERVSRTWRRLAHRALRQLVDVDFERDFPGAITDPIQQERILKLCSRRLRRVTFRVTSKNERYSVFASEHHLTKAVVEALASTATALQSIVIDRVIITIGAVEAFSQLPSTLEEFSIANCRMSCSTPEVNEIVQVALRQLLCRSPNLKRFEITPPFYHTPPVQCMNSAFGRGRSFISSADLVVLIDMAPSLTTLDLTSCVNITDGTLLGQLYNLRCLYLGNNRELTDDSVLNICTGCPRLQRLSLDNCNMLTLDSLLGLGLLCDLKWLCLAGVSGVDDHVLARLTNCRQIQMLDIKFCRNVTEVGLMVILDLPMLTRLEVHGVPAYSNRLLQNVTRVPATILSDCLVRLPICLPPLPSSAVS